MPKLTRVVDSSSGREFRFAYTGDYITSISLYLGAVDKGVMVSYGYDANGNLTSVAFPDGSGWVYEYNDTEKVSEETFHINNMTRKSNPAGHTLSTWSYDDQDRCTYNDTVDDRGVTIDYDTTPNAVRVTDAYGETKVINLTRVNGKKRIGTVQGLSGCTS